ncbi:MAG: hypothetical protein HC841_00960, partial [Verrucomicrobiae bacterium]|nr:hypothetical protein [Verrucomicrobiae bacterium]
MAKTGFELSLALTGVMCLFLGLMKIGEASGMVALLARGLEPLFQKLMPEVPPGHPAFGSITMNMVANALGLDNAATPLGLKAMRDLQEINPNADKTIASNAQILFLVINTSAVTIIPVSIFTYRAAAGSEAITSVFVPLLIATTASTLVGRDHGGHRPTAAATWSPVV